jgi:hypothetical protein
MQLEKDLIDDVMIIPIFEVVNKDMFSERVRTAVDQYQSGLGWGFAYIEIQ